MPPKDKKVDVEVLREIWEALQWATDDKKAVLVGYIKDAQDILAKNLGLDGRWSSSGTNITKIEWVRPKDGLPKVNYLCVMLTVNTKGFHQTSPMAYTWEAGRNVFENTDGVNGEDDEIPLTDVVAWAYWPKPFNPVERQAPEGCECDNTHDQNKTVCRACAAAGLTYETAWWKHS